MAKEQYKDCDELFDDDGNGICEGQKVRVNGDFGGIERLDGNNKFHIEGWPTDKIIESVEVIIGGS